MTFIHAAILTLSRIIGGHGMLQVDQTLEEEERALEEYLKDTEDDVLKPANPEAY